MSADVMAPTRAEAIADEFETQRPHPDVVCPPDPATSCKHCGIGLGDHTTVAPDQTPTPANAICLDDASLLAKALVWNRFELAPGQTYDCPEATVCTLCGTEVCGQHSTTEIVTCSDSTLLHHAECVDRCDDCVRAYAETAAEDRAVEQWKGCW